MKRQVIIKMKKFNMFITAFCVLFLIKLRWPKNISIYDTVFERYGQQTLKIVREYDKDLTCFNKASLDISFLQKCKLFHIYPTFLNFKLSKEKFHRMGAYRRFKENLLRNELTQKTSTRRKFQLFYESACSSLKTILSPLDYNHICSVIDVKALKIKHRNRASSKRSSIALNGSLESWKSRT